MPKRSHGNSKMLPETWSCFLFAGNPTMKIGPGMPTSRTLDLRERKSQAIDEGSEIEARRVHAINLGSTGYTVNRDDAGEWKYLDAWGFEVTRYRHQTGKTNQQIADDLCISKNYFQAICYGQKAPGIEVVLMAAMVFRIDPTRLSDHPALLYLVEQFGRRLKVR
jgi:hypothetical protein